MTKGKRTLADLTDLQLDCRRGHLWGDRIHVDIQYNDAGTVTSYTEKRQCHRCEGIAEQDIAVPSFDRIGSTRYTNFDPSYHINEYVTGADVRKECFQRWLAKQNGVTK